MYGDAPTLTGITWTRLFSTSNDVIIDILSDRTASLSARSDKVVL